MLNRASVALPKAALIRLQIVLIPLDFVGEMPPCFSGSAIAHSLASCQRIEIRERPSQRGESPPVVALLSLNVA